MNLQCYLGRIEEPDGEDGHLVRLFERPSGTELLTTLRQGEHLRGEPARVGTVLRVWTWTEHDAQGRGTDRLYVEILPPGPRLEAIRQELSEWTDLDWGTGDDGT